MNVIEYQEFTVDYYRNTGRLPYQDRIEFEDLLDDTTLLENAFTLPPERAIAYLKSKNFEVTWSWQDMDAQAHQRAFTVAKAMSLDLLQTIRDKLVQAQREGTPFREFAKNIEPQLQAAGWWGKKYQTNPATGKEEEVQLGSPSRLKTIYQTNLHSAAMAGRWEQQVQAAAFRPYLQYLSIIDRRTTPLCNRLNGSVFRIDDPIWKTYYPPNHYNCRALVVSLSQRDIDRMGIRVVASDELRTQINPIAGFNTAPGAQEWEPDLSKYAPALALEYKRAVQAKPKTNFETEADQLREEFAQRHGGEFNIDTSIRARQLFRTIFGDRIKLRDIVKTFVIEDEINGYKPVANNFTFRVNEDGHLQMYTTIDADNGRSRVGYIDAMLRTFSIVDDVRYVSHDTLEVNKKFQGQGTAKNLFKRSLALYLDAGLDVIDIYAGLENGHAVWPRFGFDILHPAIFRDNLRIYMMKWGVDMDVAKREVEALQHSWEFLEYDKTLPSLRGGTVQITGQAWKAANKFGWPGEFQLRDNSPSRKQLEKYLGIPASKWP